MLVKWSPVPGFIPGCGKIGTLYTYTKECFRRIVINQSWFRHGFVFGKAQKLLMF